MVQAGPEEQGRPIEEDKAMETAQRQMEAPSLSGEQAANTAKAAEGQPEMDEGDSV